MKKIVKIFCLSGFILLALSNGLAQERKITEEEMTHLLNKATESLRTQPYRRKTTSESFENERGLKPYWYITSTLYEKNNDGYRSVYNSKNKDGGSKTTEMIEVNNRSFTRDNNEAWKEVTQDKLARRIGTITKLADSAEEKIIEYRYVRKDKINKMEYDLYEKKTIRKFRVNNNNYSSIYLEKFWFNEKGQFFKLETITENNKKVTFRSISEYEYDPNIKIEIPIIDEKEKP